MDSKIFPRTSLDKPIENPDVNNSIEVKSVYKDDEEIINNVVTSLKNMTKKEP